MDHCEREKRKINPREKANILSQITFCYIFPLFRKALKKDLEEQDLYEVTRTCNSKTRGDQAEKKWRNIIKNGGKPTMAKLLWGCFGWRYFFLGMIHLTFKTARSIIEPHAMSQLIGYFKIGQTELTLYDAYYYAAVIMSLNVIWFIYIHNWILAMQNLAIQIRTALSSLIYRKALKLTPSALVDINFGNIVTLITKDVQTFQNSIWMINDMWIYTIQAFVICGLLYIKMGAISFIGIGVMLSLMPLQLYLGKKVTDMRLIVGAKTDERLQITQETLSAIRIIKMYTWETYFDKKVTEARKKELSAMLKGFYIRIVVIILGILGSKVSFYTLVSVYLWLGRNASADLIFYIVACFTDLKWSLGYIIPAGLARAGELYASVSRINAVLQAEELQKPGGSDEITLKPKIEMKGVVVKIKDAEILKDISTSINSGLTLVTGIVGSGKSALLKTMLQDYPKDSGHLVTFGRISYASQDPWLFPSSVKQNVLFGEHFNPARYDEVVRVCALKFDLDLLDHGDETIVSDKGINLSKGQQARINLARAVYRDSEIYLLDDSLTALDAHVQDFIFRECIKGFLKDKLVVLVTQSPAHLEEADNVIIMHNGSIKSSGRPSKNLIEEVTTILGADDDIEKESKENEINEQEHKVQDDEAEEDNQLIEAEQTIKKKVYHETKKVGSVHWGIYHKYLVYGGGYFMFFVSVALFLTSQYSESYSDKLLSRWTDYTQKFLLCKQNTTNITITINATDPCETVKEDGNWVFNLFSAMIVISIATSLAKSYALLNFARVASLNIHKAMTHTIINAVMHFFDSHFIGNIINRFSQDLSNIDEQLPNVLQECFRVTFSVGGIVFLLATVHWTFLLGAVVFLAILFVLRLGYMPTGRSLKRLEAATRSPLLGHLNASLEGLTTIRAFKQQEILKDEFDRHQDLYTSAHFTWTITMRAFGFLMDFMCSCFIFTVVSRFLFFDSGTTAGSVGLALTQVFMLAGHVQWGVRQWSELENQMTSVERVIEYTEIKPENTAGQIPQNWPNKGAVKYNNVSLTYHNTHEKVLKNLNIEVEGGQKIGIVGRTGAGKSSIISTLFRLHDIEGNITIDGIDTKTVQLYFLRQSIAIIPQDPVLFTGTMRSNIDPLGKYSDEEIWEAIRKVKIKGLVPSLDFEITESGNNFSSGQKQLICLARAIIRKNKIVVLDEATANMDPETDALLHNTIKENFSNCTVFTIAHRLHSIIGCDKVLALDRGNVIEYDSPTVLLQNKNGLFYKMVEQSGLLTQK